MEFLAEYGLYILMMTGITSIIYAVTMTPISDMARGYVKLAYQALTIGITISAYYMFGRKAMLYTFDGILLFFTLAILISLKDFGPAQAVSDFMYFLMNGGDAQGFMKRLELHDAVFALGAGLVYFILLPRTEQKQHWFRILLGTIYFMLGFKRIGIIAVIVCFMIYVVTNAAKGDWNGKSLRVGVWLTAIGFGYVAVTHYGVFEKIMVAMGVDTMGRNELYEFITDYYSFSLISIGRGFEFVTQLMKTATFGSFNMAKIGAIHNGFLTIYIEFGFFGFFLWSGYWSIWQMKWLRRYNTMVVYAHMMITIYLYITYLTDNTAFYFFTGIAARLVPMMFLEEEATQCSRKTSNEN